jgi:hypothetical protein
MCWMGCIVAPNSSSKLTPTVVRQVPLAQAGFLTRSAIQVPAVFWVTPHKPIHPTHIDMIPPIARTRNFFFFFPTVKRQLGGCWSNRTYIEYHSKPRFASTNLERCAPLRTLMRRNRARILKMSPRLSLLESQTTWTTPQRENEEEEHPQKMEESHWI